MVSATGRGPPDARGKTPKRVDCWVAGARVGLLLGADSSGSGAVVAPLAMGVVSGNNCIVLPRVFACGDASLDACG